MAAVGATAVFLAGLGDRASREDNHEETPMELPPTIFLTFVAGGALAIGWGLTCLLAKLGCRAWNWIDDNDQPIKINPLLAWIMRRLGYEKASYETHQTFMSWSTPDGKKKTDGEFAFFIPLLILFWAPTAIYIGLWLYPVTLAAITLFLIAYVARFARRHRKLFEKHLKDPDAHR